MGCYLSDLKIIIYKYLFIFKKQYVELRGENMGSTTIDSFFLLLLYYYYFLFIYLFFKTCKSSLEAVICFYYYLFFYIFFNIQILLF